MAANGRTATKTEEQQELEREKRPRSTTGEELPSRAPRWSAYLARPASKWQEKLKSGVGQPHGPLRGGAEGYWRGGEGGYIIGQQGRGAADAGAPAPVDGGDGARGFGHPCSVR